MKRKIIIIIIIVLLIIINLCLYDTYATSLIASNDDNSYSITLNNSLEEITIPAGKSKTILYHVTNIINGKLQYGIVYSGSNIEVKIYDDSEDASSSIFDYGDNKFIKLYIVNNGTTDSTASIKTVLGYENGGELIIPSGYTLVTKIYTKPQNLTTFITNLYTNADKTTVTNNSITYNYATSVSLMNDRLGGTASNLDGGNIRYYGASPNNYIYFNCSDYGKQTSDTCELWRIIGVFDGKVKITRNETIGRYSWDNKDITTGAELDEGKNDWTDARIMKLLNPGYESEAVGGSLYYNSLSGDCYKGASNAKVSCDFTSIGIKNEITRNMISDTLYYLGGAEQNTAEIYPNQAYVYERGTAVYSGRATTWTGKITLAYLSDHAYAADLGSCSQTLWNYNNSACESTNWMVSDSRHILSPVDRTTAAGVWRVATKAYNGATAYTDYNIIPVLHLSPKIGINTIGDGTISNPYQLQI